MTFGKSIVTHDSLVWSFHMRRLSVLHDRSSQADSINLFFNWFREFHTWPVRPESRNYAPPWLHSPSE
eukprot:1881118-Amphidinium_carterae.1